MTESVRIFADPICVDCWLTYRWLREVDQLRPLDLRVHGYSMRLRREDILPPEPLARRDASLGLLRIMEAVRDRYGEPSVRRVYEAFEVCVQHERVSVTDLHLAEILAVLDLDPAMIAAASDPLWDRPIKARMRECAAAYGTDLAKVPVPVLVFEDGTALAGPGWSTPPEGADALRAYDAVRALAAIPQFVEVMRPGQEDDPLDALPLWAPATVRTPHLCGECR
ncbi:MAG: hypothetical protein ACJ73S_06470 [Mycobacteriales bacterium]